MPTYKSDMQRIGRFFLFFVIGVCLFIPFIIHPFAINIYPDIGSELYDIISLYNTSFSFGTSYEALSDNVFVTFLKNGHGIARFIVMFPLLYTIDLFHIAINSTTVLYLQLLILIILYTFVYRALAHIYGSSWSIKYIILLATIPYFVMQVKAGWWQVYTYALLVFSLRYMHDFLCTKKRSFYVLFCLWLSLYILSNPGFLFGILFLSIYVLSYYIRQYTKPKVALKNLYSEIIKNVWTLVPLFIICGLFVVSYISAHFFGIEFGVMGKVFAKTSSVSMHDIQTYLFFFAHQLGLYSFVAFVFFAIILVWSIRNVKSIYKQDILSFSSLVYIIIGLLLFLYIGRNASTYTYELLVPGIILVITVIDKFWKSRYTLLVFLCLVVGTYMQTFLYAVHYQPPISFFTKQHELFVFDDGYRDICRSLWCSSYFGSPTNIGIKTLGYVLRHDMEISPISYESRDDYFVQKPKEIFFASFGQGSLIHLGRRVTFKLEDMNNPDVVIVYTPYTLEIYPELQLTVDRSSVIEKMYTFGAYGLHGLVVKGDKNLIEIYQRSYVGEVTAYDIEIYDVLFDQTFAHLDHLAID